MGLLKEIPGYLALEDETSEQKGHWIGYASFAEKIIVTVNATTVHATTKPVLRLITHTREAPGAAPRLKLKVAPDSFSDGDTVTGGTSGATADVTRTAHEESTSGRVLVLESVTGRFEADETITSGGDSATVEKFFPAAEEIIVDEKIIDGVGNTSYIFSKEIDESAGWVGAVRLSIDPGGESFGGDVNVSLME